MVSQKSTVLLVTEAPPRVIVARSLTFCDEVAVIAPVFVFSPEPSISDHEIVTPLMGTPLLPETTLPLESRRSGIAGLRRRLDVTLYRLEALLLLSTLCVLPPRMTVHVSQFLTALTCVCGSPGMMVR